MLPFLCITWKVIENKTSAIIKNVIHKIEQPRPNLLFRKYNAHECLWEHEEPCGSSGSGLVSLVKGKPDSNTTTLPTHFLPHCPTRHSSILTELLEFKKPDRDGFSCSITDRLSALMSEKGRESIEKKIEKEFFRMRQCEEIRSVLLLIGRRSGGFPSLTPRYMSASSRQLSPLDVFKPFKYK